MDGEVDLGLPAQETQPDKRITELVANANFGEPLGNAVASIVAEHATYRQIMRPGQSDLQRELAKQEHAAVKASVTLEKVRNPRFGKAMKQVEEILSEVNASVESPPIDDLRLTPDELEFLGIAPQDRVKDSLVTLWNKKLDAHG